MKKIKKHLILFIIYTMVIFVGCNNKTVEGDSKQKKDSISFNDSAIRSSNINNDNVIDERSMNPYKQVDSLVQLIKQQYNSSEIKKLDSICFTSDGDLAESLGETTVDLFSENLKNFTNYLLNNPKSCLKDKLIQGLGANFSVYERTDRPGKLLKEQENVIEKAKKEGLSKDQLKFILDLFKEVNPNLLD